MAFSKHIFVTGGVASSLGKGIIASSLGKLLQARGYSVTIQKFDPYINIDPGTLNPYEHGECYVTDDGAETDLDLGHYERFLNVSTSQANNVTTGRIYNNVISKERKGAYSGKTVQVIPHITDEIKRNFLKLDSTGQYDIVITEIGGCVGDIESLPFIEAVRQLRWELGGINNVIVVHLTLVPYLKAAGELKTKPSQHSVRQLAEAGIQPDVLVCRSEYPLPGEIRKKLSLFCNVDFESVIEALDSDSIYHVPILMHKERLDITVMRKLRLPYDDSIHLDSWKAFLDNLKNPEYKVEIALVGKYVELHDAYKSIAEALTHASVENKSALSIRWVQSDKLTANDIEEKLQGVDGILVAPGFGNRGIEGKLLSVKRAREKQIPFLGICLGMQCASVEFARNVLGHKKANSTEFDKKTKHPVIGLMESQKKVENLGGTMRLGAYPCELKKGSLASKVYEAEVIYERHRHRYEFNNDYLKAFEEAGMIASGINPEGNLVEVIELKEHPWFLGTQFHPELKSRVENPHPLFIKFIEASLKYQNHKMSNKKKSK